MCGIVACISSGPAQDVVPVIVEGLGRLAYRGYDSAGVAAMAPDGQIDVRRDVGKLERLRARLAVQPLNGPVGIGHTRWATHGAPAEHNAHPHLSDDGSCVLVHNGIVENYLALRDQLKAAGLGFRSETDTEVIVQLIAYCARQAPDAGITAAVRCALRELRGAHALVIMSRHDPGLLIAARIGNAGGVAVGIGADAHYIASDIPAILEHTRRMVFLEDRQMALVRAEGFVVESLDDDRSTPQRIELPVQHIPWDPVSAVKGAHKHFMQKEIHDQPRAITDTIGGRIDFEHSQVLLPELKLSADRARALRRIVITACGTSYYSGLVGKFYIEKLARIPVEVDYGSEYRYRDPIIDADTALLAITQSGETVDTLAAMDEGRRQGALIWSIVNAVGSQAMRSADGCIPMHAGPEIGVASTKAFTTSIVDQLLLAVTLGQMRGTLDDAARRALVADIARLPDWIGRTLDEQAVAAVDALAAALHHYSDFLFLGRGINYPIALEGALKLKEISYIHAEGYPAGEMKHGPIALIDENMPVLALLTEDGLLYDKMLSQVEQAQARGAVVIAVANEDDARIGSRVDHVLRVPRVPSLLTPVVGVVPLQLLAYTVAVRRGADVDQPRNLAKSVTVE